MKQLSIVILSFIFAINTYAKDIPLSDGKYVFSHRFAEHPNMKSIKLDAVIKDGGIILINNDKADVLPLGTIDKGELYWHQETNQWIIIHSSEDKNATDVGGCSGGPSTLDFIRKTYWTC